jgi:hypothetical protein
MPDAKQAPVQHGLDNRGALGRRWHRFDRQLGQDNGPLRGWMRTAWSERPDPCRSSPPSPHGEPVTTSVAAVAAAVWRRSEAPRDRGWAGRQRMGAGQGQRDHVPPPGCSAVDDVIARNEGVGGDARISRNGAWRSGCRTGSPAQSAPARACGQRQRDLQNTTPRTARSSGGSLATWENHRGWDDHLCQRAASGSEACSSSSAFDLVDPAGGTMNNSPVMTR